MSTRYTIRGHRTDGRIISLGARRCLANAQAHAAKVVNYLHPDGDPIWDKLEVWKDGKIVSVVARANA